LPLLWDQPAQFDALVSYPFADRPVTCPKMSSFSLSYNCLVLGPEFGAICQSLSTLSRQSAESANNGDKRNVCRFMTQPTSQATGMPELGIGAKDSYHTTTDLFHHSITQRYQVADYTANRTYTWMEATK